MGFTYKFSISDSILSGVFLKPFVKEITAYKGFDEAGAELASFTSIDDIDKKTIF